jgi:hypothetical protein
VEDSKESKSINIQLSENLGVTDGSGEIKIIKIFDELTKYADEAFENGHYLESAIIVFQLVEYFLRLTIHILAKQKNCSEKILEKTRLERSFFKLVIFLGLVKSDNGISERLFNLNNRRNQFMHKLFEQESVESIKTDLIDFYKESLESIEGLKSLIPKKLSEMI